VILCGGAGERLWPASRPWRPKPFLRFVGDRSGFEAAILRAAPLASGGPLLVVGGASHRDLIAEELTAVGASATVLLEPAGRGTAAAVAAAAAWARRHTPEAIVAVLPADHHVPDADAFRAAVAAAAEAAAGGAIVTLGLRPTVPATAYGYIRPREAAGPVKPIAAFVEKPNRAAAEALVADGALWNCGVFIGRAQTFAAELKAFAPDVFAAADQAVTCATGEPEILTLGAAFAEAPRIAFDRAVMEKTALGAVLPSAFAWSDLGAWDAVAAAAGQTTFVRAAPGVKVSLVGVSGVAVVAEPDAVLVAALTQSQAVRNPEGPPPSPFGDLAMAAEAYETWLRTSALPLWATVGVDAATGAFREALTWHGVPADPQRRVRVQARQAFVFASAAADGAPGPWLTTARRGFDAFLAKARRPDGLFATVLDLAGAQTQPEPHLYEHAFILLALAGLRRADRAGDDAEVAVAVRERLTIFRHPAGGFREAGDTPFQANAQMHLLEAALAWEALDPDPGWRALADEIAGIALEHLIDPATGVLHEVLDADWRPLTGEAGLIEPGHQFEWAWLIARWGADRRELRAQKAARRLFQAGRRAFDPRRGVIQNAVWADLSIRDAGARLWPQTEHLKAALILDEREAAEQAAASLVRYLDTPARGVWRERMRPDGGFIDQPAPATSLYHLYLAIRELTRFAAKA
jgi:mannose-1-phosphate guanylyltransferase/mannose/cellobiose epimerase-like protein (N-acyl-D-glucosamine 2-epimerase family)